MKIFYVTGSYSGSDMFAEPISTFGHFNLRSATRQLFDEFQTPLNENCSEMDFQYKTELQIVQCPVVSDGYNYWGVFKVLANSEDEAMLVTLKIYNKIKDSNQVI